jgi:hypothetical protein
MRFLADRQSRSYHQEALHYMTKRLVSAAATLAAIGGAALALAPSAMAFNGGTYTLQGTANFGTPLTLGPGASPFTYTFSGNLSNCESGNSSPAAAPQGLTGKISTPVAVSGSGSCASSTTGPGVAVVQWSDGTTTVEKYSTTGALAAVLEQGTVIPSFTYQSGTDPTTGQPIFTTDTTTNTFTPVGDTGDGALTFQPPSPTSCSSGVTSATIRGQIFTGGSA